MTKMVSVEEKEEEREERERREGAYKESTQERDECKPTIESRRCDECATERSARVCMRE